jgi:hypothetical protein
LPEREDTRGPASRLCANQLSDLRSPARGLITYAEPPNAILVSGRLSDASINRRSAPWKITHRSGNIMNNDQRSFYKGWSITTRWAVAGPPSNWLELNAPPSSWGERFSASFICDPGSTGVESARQFPKGIFDTIFNATDNAVNVAIRMIDSRAVAG